MMGSKRPLLRFQSLSTRIVALVVGGLAFFALVTGFVTHGITRDWLERTAIANLEAVASARQAAVVAWLADTDTILNAFVHHDFGLQLEAARDSADEKVMMAYRHDCTTMLLQEIQIDPHLLRADIFGMDGAVLMTTLVPKTLVPARDPNSLVGLQTHRHISEPMRDQAGTFLELSVPLRSADAEVLAILILRLDARELVQIVGDFTGLGETGETVLGSRHGEMIRFLTPLRFDPNLSLTSEISIHGAQAMPMIHATAGQEGVIRAADYRHEPVIAAFRPIPTTGWGMVIKQDQAEAFASVTALRTTLTITLAALLFVAILITPPLARSVMLPLRELHTATQRVAAGDLTATVPAGGHDEVGLLATSFNRMVERLSAAHAELENSNEELKSFAYVVSHDLKAPLRGISSLSQWLLEDVGDELEGEQKENLELIMQRVKRMDALVNDLLTYSRIGRIEGSPVSIDVAQLLDDVFDSLAPAAIKMEVVLPMPVLQADELRLTQVFMNLIGNAIEHHPGPEGRVEVSCRDADTHWEFAVTDDGDGIEPRHHARVFEIFQSLSAPKDDTSTGIGLALVKKIVTYRGGRIWLESEGISGAGATFRFTWPKAKKGTVDE